MTEQTKTRRPFYIALKIFEWELIGLYANVVSDNALTIFGVRFLNNILIGLCRNELHYFIDCTCLIWPNFSRKGV